MTLKTTRPVDGETPDEGPGAARRNGSLGHRFAPQGRHIASPKTGSRAQAHRPPPLDLTPPPPPRNLSYNAHSNDNERVQGRGDGDPGDGKDLASDSRDNTPGGTAPLPSRKRPCDSATPPSEYEDDEVDDEDGDIADSRFDMSVTQTPVLSEGHLADDSFCLCREQKIPRPRNVFMLYRQSYQSQVVARNPGIANPDISKIIGKMWRELDGKGKAYWKQRAEEEKLRHREMYPDYRYQPKRAKKKNTSGEQQGTASSLGSESRSGAAGDGPDLGTCDKCGRRLKAPPLSSRSIPSSVRLAPTPSSPFVAPHGRMQSASFDGFDVDEDRSRPPHPSPSPKQHQSPPRGRGAISREAVGRRPLPPYGRPGSVGAVPRGYPSHKIEDTYAPSDQRMRHYEPPTPFSAQFSPYENGEGSMHPSYMRLPYRPASDNISSSLNQIPHSASVSQYPSSGPAPPPASPWMGPPPPPMRHAPRGYAGHPPPRHSYDTIGGPLTPASGHPARGEGHGIVPSRLPPPTPQDGYGYYQVSGPGSAAAGPPTRPMPTPTSAQTAFGRSTLDSGRIPASNLARLSGSSMAPDQSASNVRGSTGSNGPPTGKLAATPAHFQDMRTFASSPTPIVARRDDDGNIVDRDSQASGIRAMVMSVSYLKKYEVLRRISPPRPVPPRRGPFIAIEGHNAALRDAVGRIVERALVSCGECNIRSWTMAPLEGDEADGVASGIHGTQKRNTDSGVGSSIHGEDVSMAPSPESGGDCNSRRGSTSFESAHPTSLSFTISTIEDLMRLVPTWHKIATEINDHIHTDGGSSEILGSVPLSRKGKDISNGPPSPARSPMDLRLSPASLSSALQSEGSSKASESSRMVQTCDGSQASASPSLHSTTTALANSQPSQLLPVALVTTGYSLAIADKCAISIPINDSFPPIAHWEYMAGLWRGTPGPDLVVYADPSPPPLTSNGARGPTVHFMDQEGILVAHIPPPKTAVDKQVGSADHSKDTNSNDKDGDDDGSSVMDQKTERRLTFEILELVRSGNFGAFKEET